MNFFRQFPRSFWVSNFMELFERMAYYGMYNVLALYLTGQIGEGCLGFSKQSTGLMMGIYTFFLYMIPIFGGAMADRYGYKKAFVFALSSLSIAYFTMAYTKSYYAIFAALMLVSMGGAVFKPTLTGTISKTTDEKTSSLGFGIYYMIVNIGGFLGPLVASTLRVHNWSYVFLASSIWVGLMLIPAVFLYREPGERDAKEKERHGFGHVIADSMLVIANWRFMTLLVIFSGFWIVFFQLFLTMSLYLRDYVNTLPLLEAVKNLSSALHAPWTAALEHRISLVAAGTIRAGEAVPPELLTNLDAGAIILFQLVVSRITSCFRPLPAMIGGIAVAGCAMFIAGSTQVVWIVLLSIFVLALGEMAASPKFLEYVGKIAPPEQVALFLGYGFLPIGIGSFVANTLGGTMYSLLEAHRITPMMMWSVYGAIALVTAFLLALYHRYIAPGLTSRPE
ncbi:MAG: MFS transporter [Candidatus Eremiobacteraeota bacterium]|nr:MFS transporter [Candidatus Eremiobacteraeota bacterium]